MGPEPSDLQGKFSCKLSGRGTEYLWHVSLTRSDQILLSNDEAAGFWGSDVFSSDGPDGDQSIISGMAYWAGGMDAKEFGEPIMIRIMDFWTWLKVFKRLLVYRQ